MKFISPLFCICFFCINAFAQILSIETGALYFLGDLQKQIKIAPSLGAGVELELSDYTTGYLQGSYSYLKLKTNKDFNGLHQFIGRAGIETSERLVKFVNIGVGISLAGVRGSAATANAEDYMLSSSESEFGWNARIKFNIFRFKKFTVGTDFYYDRIWTKPKNSHLISGNIIFSM